MSVQTPESDTRRYQTSYPAEEGRGDGWVGFAGVILLIVGALNCIDGIAAIGNANFFVNGAHYMAGSLNTWGWIVLGIGVCQLLVGIGIFARNQFARWAGVLVLAANAIAQLMFIPAYPFWSLSIFTLDILALYGLVAYGSRVTTAKF